MKVCTDCNIHETCRGEDTGKGGKSSKKNTCSDNFSLHETFVSSAGWSFCVNKLKVYLRKKTGNNKSFLDGYGLEPTCAAGKCRSNHT